MLFPRIQPQSQHIDPKVSDLLLIQTEHQSVSSYREETPSPSRLQSSTYNLETEEQKVTTTIYSTVLNPFKPLSESQQQQNKPNVSETHSADLSLLVCLIRPKSLKSAWLSSTRNFMQAGLG